MIALRTRRSGGPTRSCNDYVRCGWPRIHGRANHVRDDVQVVMSNGSESHEGFTYTVVCKRGATAALITSLCQVTGLTSCTASPSSQSISPVDLNRPAPINHRHFRLNPRSSDRDPLHIPRPRRVLCASWSDGAPWERIGNAARRAQPASTADLFPGSAMWSIALPTKR